jgi:hypothetical protein
MKRTWLAFTVILLTAFTPLTSTAADSPMVFTVIVRAGEHSPDLVSVEVGTTVQYKNVDTRENVTHYIGFDGNGDGDFTDTGEFSSGPLNGTCDWENDSDCRVAWIFVINSTDYVGNYNLIDYTNNNETHYVCLEIKADDHDEGHDDEHDKEDGHCHDDDHSTTEATAAELTTEDILQRGGAFFLLMAAFLVISMLARPRR